LIGSIAIGHSSNSMTFFDFEAYNPALPFLEIAKSNRVRHPKPSLGSTVISCGSTAIFAIRSNCSLTTSSLYLD
jgi:hypothetical protein